VSGRFGNYLYAGVGARSAVDKLANGVYSTEESRSSKRGSSMTPWSGRN